MEDKLIIVPKFNIGESFIHDDGTGNIYGLVIKNIQINKINQTFEYHYDHKFLDHYFTYYDYNRIIFDYNTKKEDIEKYYDNL